MRRRLVTILLILEWLILFLETLINIGLINERRILTLKYVLILQKWSCLVGLELSMLINYRHTLILSHIPSDYLLNAHYALIISSLFTDILYE